jgi:hypothetical protein
MSGTLLYFPNPYCKRKQSDRSLPTEDGIEAFQAHDTLARACRFGYRKSGKWKNLPLARNEDSCPWTLPISDLRKKIPCRHPGWSVNLCLWNWHDIIG